MIKDDTLKNSDLIKRIEQVKKRVDSIKKTCKQITKQQINTLKKNGNICDDWKKIRLGKKVNLANIRQNYFSGEIYILENTNMVPLDLHNHFSAGIFHSTLHNCIIDSNVILKDNKFISNYYIAPNSILINNGTITCLPFPHYANGSTIPVGIETDGREVQLFAEITIGDATQQTMDTSYPKESWNIFIDQYIKKIKFEKGIIDNNSKLFNNDVIKNSFIGESAKIENSLKISESTILSSSNEKTKIADGVYINNSIIQWGCEVRTMSIVESSVLTEHSHVERHAKVTHSIVGPNTSIAEGEVTSSLVGPFVGFHHQALLIAALWPEGKGNVGYGANVGSNHTSKAPDQEIIIGEGMFFGLGVNIKFPSNFSQAPYSIISTGTITLPQKVEFPFSLINSPTLSLGSISPSYNEIIPAWVLSDNIYMMKRNEGKFKKRNKAKRSSYNFAIFRTDIIHLVIQAREKLRNIKEKKEIYLDSDIAGLGKNYLKEENRSKAIENYSFFIKYYALQQLKQKLQDIEKKDSSLIWDVYDSLTHDINSEADKKLLLEEFPNQKNLSFLLDQYLTYERQIAERVKNSKQKDDIRGEKIIPDYKHFHTLAENDDFVIETYQQLDKIKQEIEALKQKIN